MIAREMAAVHRDGQQGFSFQEFILIGLLGKMVVFSSEEIREQLSGMTGVMEKIHFGFFRDSKK
jgi:hypothetical protein